MKLTQAILIDSRMLLVLIAEIKRSRLADLRFERSSEPALRD